MKYIYVTKCYKAYEGKLLEDMLNEYALEGWRLHTAVQVNNHELLCIFEKEVV